MQEPTCAAGNIVLLAAVADILLAVAVTWYRILRQPLAEGERT